MSRITCSSASSPSSSEESAKGTLGDHARFPPDARIARGTSSLSEAALEDAADDSPSLSSTTMTSSCALNASWAKYLPFAAGAGLRSWVFFRLGGFPAGALGLRFDGGFCEVEEGFAGVVF